MTFRSSTPAQIGYATEPPVLIPTTLFTPVPVVGSGLLSQTLQNLQNSILPLTLLTGLPDEAQSKRDTVISVLAADVEKIVDAQSAVKQFATDALPRLRQARTNLDANTNPDQVTATISQTRASALSLKQRLDALSNDINSTRTQIADLSASLAPLRRTIQDEQTEINARIDDIQDERSRLSNPWIALGTLLTGRLDDLTTQLRDIVIKFGSLETYRQSVDAIITDFSGVINQISYLGNAVQFIAGDNSNVIGDLNHAKDDDDAQGDQLPAKVYLTTAISQLQLLKADAA